MHPADCSSTILGHEERFTKRLVPLLEPRAECVGNGVGVTGVRVPSGVVVHSNCVHVLGLSPQQTCIHILCITTAEVHVVLGDNVYYQEANFNFLKFHITPKGT